MLWRCRCDGKKHRFGRWKSVVRKAGFIKSRSCECGAVQHYNVDNGEVMIWTPDGVDSGLIRKTFEQL